MSTLDLDVLVVLDAIDRSGSFAGAARRLDRVPSAITYTVRRLEDQLDVLLFDRRGRRAVPTPAGRLLLEQGRLLLDQAAAIEQRVQRVATGWEADLAIAVDTLVPMGRIWPMARQFDLECRAGGAAHTRLAFSHEVLGGTWDALVEGRVDLVIGAPGDPPPGGGFRTRLMAEAPMAFVVAPSHPLASAREPIPESALLAHRSVVAADSSRRLPPRSVGLLTGQDTLTVASLADKRAAQVAGLGCGWLPWFLVAEDVAVGRLVARSVDVARHPARLVAAWRDARPGKALQWWIDAIGRSDWRFLAADPAPGAAHAGGGSAGTKARGPASAALRSGRVRRG